MRDSTTYVYLHMPKYKIVQRLEDVKYTGIFNMKTNKQQQQYFRYVLLS